MDVRRRVSHGGSSGSVRIFEREVFDDAGEVVRCAVVSDGLEQIGTNLNGVAGLVANDSCFRLSDELAIHVQQDFSPGIPICFETDRTSDRRDWVIRLNGQDKLKKTMQTVAIQRETARHESMRRAVLNSSRVFRRRLELFVASVAEWEGDVVQLLMAA